jgi:hypothetical protein
MLLEGYSFLVGKLPFKFPIKAVPDESTQVCYT